MKVQLATGTNYLKTGQQCTNRRVLARRYSCGQWSLGRLAAGARPCPSLYAKRLCIQLLTHLHINTQISWSMRLQLASTACDELPLLRAAGVKHDVHVEVEGRCCLMIEGAAKAPCHTIGCVDLQTLHAVHWLFPGRESAFRRPSSQWLDGRLAVSGPC